MRPLSILKYIFWACTFSFLYFTQQKIPLVFESIYDKRVHLLIAFLVSLVVVNIFLKNTGWTIAGKRTFKNDWNDYWIRKISIIELVGIIVFISFFIFVVISGVIIPINPPTFFIGMIVIFTSILLMRLRKKQ